MEAYRETRIAKIELAQAIRTIADDNPDAADRFLDRVHERYRLLARNQELGPARPELGRGVRLFPFEKNYLIIYRPIPDGVLVLRFRHGARDLSGLF
jgi:toxin ParE1/3/4